MTAKLSDYQKKILQRLEKGELLMQSHLGPFTPAFRFNWKKPGINDASLQKLRFMKLVTMTDQMTHGGLVRFCHITGTTPWTGYHSWEIYQIGIKKNRTIQDIRRDALARRDAKQAGRKP